MKSLPIVRPPIVSIPANLDDHPQSRACSHLAITSKPAERYKILPEKYRRRKLLIGIGVYLFCFSVTLLRWVHRRPQTPSPWPTRPQPHALPAGRSTLIITASLKLTSATPGFLAVVADATHEALPTRKSQRDSVRPSSTFNNTGTGTNATDGEMKRGNVMLESGMRVRVRRGCIGAISRIRIRRTTNTKRKM